MPWLNGQTRVLVDNSVDKVDNSANRRNFIQNGAVIGLFAKQPLPGQVKTRLVPLLTAEQACRLYDIALRETFSRLRSLGLPVVICYAGQRRWFAANFPGAPLLAQVGEDLGKRMEHAAATLSAAGRRPVVLTGSDSPDLPLALLREVVEALDDRDIAVIPCEDGGYAVIGLRQPTEVLFAGMPWSSSRVMAETRRRCRDFGLSLHETVTWYDLDGPADLSRLVECSPRSRTARYLLADLRALFQTTGRKAAPAG
jgi:rSAM/selenodomain-associated transferase 1